MLYNAEQVKLMFDEHSILFYDQEGVTFTDAIRLFGNSALNGRFTVGNVTLTFLVSVIPKCLFVNRSFPTGASALWLHTQISWNCAA